MLKIIAHLSISPFLNFLLSPHAKINLSIFIMYLSLFFVNYVIKPFILIKMPICHINIHCRICFVCYTIDLESRP